MGWQKQKKYNKSKRIEDDEEFDDYRKENARLHEKAKSLEDLIRGLMKTIKFIQIGVEKFNKP